MATDQRKIAVYLPKEKADEFEALTKSEGKTITGAIRVMVDAYIATARERAAA